MDVYKATFWGSTKKPIVITEDNLIAGITDPVISTFVPKSQLTERNNLTVFKGRIIDGILQTQLANQNF